MNVKEMAKPGTCEKVSEGRCKWELRFDFRLPATRYRESIGPFFRELMNAEHLQVAYIGGHITQPNLHVHVAAVGRGRDGKTLKDIDRGRWERHWGKITGLKSGALQIGNVDAPERAEAYVMKNLMGNPDSESFFYNRKLLQKLKLV